MKKKLLFIFGIIACWISTTKVLAQTVLPCALNGTYTINASQPTIGTNFASFTEAIRKLDSCGLSGPVIFNVAQGVYNEQIRISNIPGSDSINTVLIQADPLNTEIVELSYKALNNTNNYVVDFDSASYITIRDLRLIAMDSNNYSQVIVFDGYSDNISIVGNSINSHGSSVVILKSTTSHLFNSVITDNSIYGKGSGIFWRGNITRAAFKGNSIQNNSIKGTMSSYSMDISNQTNIEVKNNIIKSLAGGISLSNCHNINVSSNTIMANSLDAVRIYRCGNNPEETNTFTNNMISAIGNTSNGIKIDDSGNIRFLHNSIFQSSDDGNAFQQVIGVVYHKNDIFNNNIVKRNSGNLIDIRINHEIKNVIIENIFSMDYNNYYHYDGAIFGLINNSDTIDNIIEWRNYSKMDSRSIIENPYFINDTNLHISSLSLRVNNPIANVSEDIDMHNRSLITPTAGADEAPNFIKKGCSSFSDLHIDSLGDSSLKMTWIPGGNSTSFYLEYGPTGFVSGSINGTMVTGNYSSSQPSVSIGGLTANTTYDLYLGEICNTNDTVAITKLTFRTDDVCPEIQNISLDLLKPDTAVFSINTFYEDYEIEWGISGYEQGTGTTYSSKNPLVVYDLIPNTTYDLYIRPDCKLGWFGPLTFTTLCNPSSSLSGVYTVDHSRPTEGRNFNSFAEAVDALNSPCGISGPVTINVAEGIYNEQIVIGNIKGASSSNTVTIQADAGNNLPAEIHHLIALDPVANEAKNYILKFENTSYVTIKGLKFKAKSQDNYSGVILFTGIGSHNVIENNIIEGKDSTKFNLTAIGDQQTVVLFSSVLRGNEISKYDSCIIKDNIIKNGNVGIAFANEGFGFNGTRTIGNLIENNIIQDFSVMAMQCYNESYLHVYNNTFQSSSFDFVAGGIDFTGSNGIFESNKLSMTINRNIFACRGLFMSGDNIIVVNNMVRIQGESPGEVQISAMGTYGHNNNIKIIYNTVLNNISGSYGGLCLDLNFTGSYSLQNSFLLNNNFVALQNGRIIEFNNHDLSANFTSNNNNFYYASGGAIGTYGNISISDLATWQAATSLDGNSVSVDPLFFSLTDLHAQSVLIDGKGIPIAEVTDDIDGDIRSVTAPDIGADEFTPKPCLPSEDFQAAQRYSDSIQLSWTPGSGMEFIIEYGVKGFTPGEGIVITGIPDSLYTISSLSPSTEYDFYIKDFCNVGDTSARIGPLTIKTLCIDNELLSGTYTINSSIPSSATNFTSLGEVASVLNNCGIKGPVTINIAEGSYSQKIALGDIYGTSAVNTVTFQSDPANINPVTITTDGLQNFNYVIQFNNTRHVTFKGLTLSTGTTTYGTVLNFQGDCRDVIIDSNNIYGSQGSPSGVEQAVIKNDNLGTPRYVNDITIMNNTIRYGSYGIYWYGVGAGNPEKGTIIENNKIEDFSTEGIRSYYQDSIRIEKNTLISNGTNSLITGMNINTNRHSQVLANTFTQKAGTGIRMENSNENLSGNNMISISGNNNTAKGISVINSKKQDMVFNSIFLNTQNNQSSCIEISGTDTSMIYNNNLVNTGGGYAVMSNTSTELTADYNNLYVTGIHIGKWNGTDITDLNSWQTQSGQDVNSVSVDPMFIATDDLHARSPLINDKGTVYNSITTDIDGETRSASTPDIGADEFITYSDDLWAVEILNPLDSNCGDSNMTVSVQIINMGSQSATGFTVQAELTGTVAAMLSQTYMGTLNSGETDTITLSSFNGFNGGSINIKAYINYSSDQRTENDTLVAYAYILRSSVLNPQSAQGYFCEGHPYDTLYFPTGMENSFSWKTTAGDVIGNTDSLVVGPLQRDTTFILSASEGCHKDGEIKITRSEMPVASFNMNLQSPETTKLTVDFNGNVSEGANTYTWSFGDGQTGMGSTISHDYTSNGSYNIQLIINGDCGSDTLTQTIEINGISIEENLISRSLEVYPNPTEDKVFIHFETGSSEEAVLSLTDLSGKEVFQKVVQDSNGKYDGEVDLSHLAKGSYMLRIESGDIKAIKRIIKN